MLKCLFQIKEGAELADIVEDRIGEILIPMGERQCVMLSDK